MKKFLKTHFGFLLEHLPIMVAILLSGAVFLHMDKFAEFGYSVLRLISVVFTAFVVIHLVFKSTIRPYILEGKFSDDFRSSQYKLQISLATIAFVIWVAMECFVHA
jgi:hypothetical protein